MDADTLSEVDVRRVVARLQNSAEEPFVGRQQRLQRLLTLKREVLFARQQRVFLTLDVAPLAALQPGILALANRIQGLTQMADDMELIEQNRRLRRISSSHTRHWFR